MDSEASDTWTRALRGNGDGGNTAVTAGIPQSISRDMSSDVLLKSVISACNI